MLFPNNRQNQQKSQNVHFITKMVPVKQPVRVPDNRQELCRSYKHPLPVLQEFKKVGFTKSGLPYAEYHCAICGHKEGWIFDSHTGKAKKLWWKD